MSGMMLPGMGVRVMLARQLRVRFARCRGALLCIIACSSRMSMSRCLMRPDSAALRMPDAYPLIKGAYPRRLRRRRAVVTSHPVVV